VEAVHAKHHQVVDVDLRSYFDTIDHEMLMQLVGRRVGDIPPRANNNETLHFDEYSLGARKEMA
jgi:hypothetical protein